MSNKNIPTDEDFARARAAMKYRDRGLSEVRSAILNHFASGGLHQMFILYSSDNDSFVAYLFFKDNHIQFASDESGLSKRIKNSVLEELERVGRGKKSTLKVDFEIDNDENVQRKYSGDYYARLS